MGFVNFKTRYPNSLHNVEADIKIDSLDWAAATVENTIEAYTRYLREHDSGDHFDEAHVAIERLEAEKAALIRDSIAAAQAQIEESESQDTPLVEE